MPSLRKPISNTKSIKANKDKKALRAFKAKGKMMSQHRKKRMMRLISLITPLIPKNKAWGKYDRYLIETQ